MDDLIDRASRGEATESELAELAAWRAASENNERQYRATLRLLDASRALAQVDAGIAHPSAAEIIARTGSRRRFAGTTVATRWAPWAIAAAAVLIAAVSLGWPRADTASTIPGWGATEVVTGASELATVQLGEGSVVRLAPSSRLRVIAGRERVVHLEGRGFFAVQPMLGNPLRVQTAAGDARVLGTRFELATHADGLELRVLEGKVALSTARQRIEVAAGEESTVQNGTVTRPTRAASPPATWVGTFLAFQATPLGEVAREIERVYGTPVTIVDTTLARQTITATFTDRPVQEVVNVVCSVLSARCDATDGRVRIDR